MRMTVDNRDKNGYVVFVQPVASASTMIASLTGEVREFISKQFPRGFFKHVHINTSEAVSSIKKTDLYDKNLSKQPYPRLIVTPEITLDDPIFGMDKMLHTSSPNMYLRQDMRYYYTPLLTDPNKEYYGYYTSDYITMNFNFQIVVDKFIQVVDLAYFLKSTFQNSMFKHLDNVMMNTEIPKSLVALIAHLSDHGDIFENIDGFDTLAKDRKKDIEDNFERYMMNIGHLDGLIMKKMRESTGKYGFFSNIKTTVTGGVFDLDVPTQVSRDSMNESEYTITFRFQASTWIPNSFMLKVKKSLIAEKVDKDFLSNVLYDKAQFASLGMDSAEPMSLSIKNVNNISFSGLRRQENDYFMVYNIDGETGEVFDRILEIDGERIIGQEIVNQIHTFAYDERESNIDISELITDDLKKVYTYFLDGNDNGSGEKKLDIKDLINIRLENDTGVIPLRFDRESDDWYSYIDYERLEVNIRAINPGDINLRVFINRPLFEGVLKLLEENKYFRVANHLGFVNYDIVIDEETNEVWTYRVRVLGFKSREEHISSDPSKRLRMKTPWGTGYIDTEPVYYKENEQTQETASFRNANRFTPEKDGIKIVVGVDSEGAPIIRRLKTYEIIKHKEG